MGGRSRKIPPRKVGNRGAPPPSMLIVCEGAKTEPNYFRAFRKRAVTVKVVGLGKNTRKLVEEALAIKNEEQPDRCWCVFDRDSFPAEHVNTAVQQARAGDCEVAISNECFELWYLLHFDYIDGALSRAQYPDMLTTRLGHPYRKNSESMYGALLEKQHAAIRNAERLLSRYSPQNPAKDNPSTTVHLLVEELNR